jgi:hypothetical protein
MCLVLAAVLALACLDVRCVSAQDTQLLFGQTAVFSGSNAELGRDMRRGINLAFQRVNAKGGMHGRNVTLLSMDDTYEPAVATVNAQELLRQNIFAMIGTVGTPTANAILPLLRAARTPLIGAFTGARALRTPFQRYALNVRASYDDELAALVQYCLARGLTLFSILWQNDSYGLAGLSALQVALAAALDEAGGNVHKGSLLPCIEKCLATSGQSNCPRRDQSMTPMHGAHKHVTLDRDVCLCDVVEERVHLALVRPAMVPHVEQLFFFQL